MKLFGVVAFVVGIALATCVVNGRSSITGFERVELQNNKYSHNKTSSRKIRDENGKCGESVFWSFNSDSGTLTITGTGQIYNYTYNTLPWSSSVQEMQKVIIEEGVTSIGDYFFHGCANLSTIEIPQSVTYIGTSAFFFCSSLKSIEIPISVTSIAGSTFYQCTSLSSIAIPTTVTYIGSCAFWGCTSLKSIEIPMNVTSIESSTFYGCSSLTSVSIPSSVTSIGSSAFYGCLHLMSISIPSSVTSIGTYAFYNTRLTSISFPTGVKTIGGFAFGGCPNLSSIEIPSSVTSIGINAFWGCRSLTSVEIFSNNLSVGDSAFTSCPNLSKVIYHGSNPLDSCSTNAFNSSAATKFCVPINYTASSFCGINTYSNSSTFNDLRNNNSCYEVFICGESISDVYVEKRAEVKRWENESNGCMSYYCDNSSGVMKWSKCESSDKIQRICNDGQCEEHIVNDGVHQHVIEVYIDGMNTTQTNANDIKELLSTTSGVSENEIEVEIETDEHYNIMRIIVYVNEEEDAISIYRTADSCKRGN